MDVEPEVKQIEKALRADAIDWQTAASEFDSLRKRRKPWKTQKWREERAQLIKSYCQQCGSSKPPLVLQHLEHPLTLEQIMYRLTGKETVREFKKKYFHEFRQSLLETRPVCPDCNSLNIRPLKRRPAWKCYKCKASHESPLKKDVLTFEGKKTLGEYKSRKKREVWEEFIQQYGEICGKQAILIQIEQHKRYLSLKDTVTFCKRCAYLWDIEGLRLCRKCNTHWHSFLYTSCIYCKIIPNI